MTEQPWLSPERRAPGTIHLALVTETYPPEVNGVARTLGKLVEGMAGRGALVEVIRPRQSRADKPKRVGRIEHVTVRGLPLPRYRGLRFGLPAKRKLKRRWRRQRPDIVHVATEGPLGRSAVHAARKLKIPVISSFHTNFHTYGKHYGYGFLTKFVLRYLRRLHNRTACTMVPSLDVKDALESAGFRCVVVLSRGVDVGMFHPAMRSNLLRQEWSAGRDVLVVAHVGRIADEKNIPLVVEAFEGIKGVRMASRLVLVGDGPARQELAEQHGDYLFAGMRHGEDLARHYASADLFLFPSTTETFGNVVLEAMASGLPVLAYDYAAARQHIRDGENGILVPFNDREAFIAVAEAAISDPALLKRLGQNARRTAEQLTWDGIVDQYEKVLRLAAFGQVSAPPRSPQAV